MILKYKNIVFDDVVKDDSGKWSQVCDSCIEKHFKDEVWDDIPIDNTICGVKDCNNEAGGGRCTASESSIGTKRTSF